jgi:hypothetical protein
VYRIKNLKKWPGTNKKAVFVAPSLLQLLIIINNNYDFMITSGLLLLKPYD